MAKSVSTFISFIFGFTGLTKLYETIKSAYDMRKSVREINNATDWVEAARKIKFPLAVPDGSGRYPLGLSEATREKVVKFDEDSAICLVLLLDIQIRDRDAASLFFWRSWDEREQRVAITTARLKKVREASDDIGDDILTLAQVRYGLDKPSGE